MGDFIRKLIPANIAGIIGVAQTLIPLVRELLLVAIRIVDVLTPKAGLEPLIVKVVAMFAVIEGWVNSLKNMFLGSE